MTKFNIYAKFGSDAKKEVEGVPFIVDAETNAHILIARWSGRNVAHALEQAELTKQNPDKSVEELEPLRVKVFAKHLIKGWQGITDINGNELPFTTENAIKLLSDLPDLTDQLLNFSLTRSNYPLDGVEVVEKN